MQVFSYLVQPTGQVT